jgi:glutamyl-tRNA synthetase
VLPVLVTAGLLDRDDAAGRRLLDRAMPLIAERINKLTESVGMLGFLFIAEENFAVEPADAAKLLDDDGRAVVRRALAVLEVLPEWSAAAIQEALQAELVTAMGLKPRIAFGPVRVAVTGRRVSPPLFESLELLGPDRSLRRLRSAVA